MTTTTKVILVGLGVLLVPPLAKAGYYHYQAFKAKQASAIAAKKPAPPPYLAQSITGMPVVRSYLAQPYHTK